MTQKEKMSEIVDSDCKILKSPSLEELRTAKLDGKPVSFTVIIGECDRQTVVEKLFIRRYQLLKPLVKGGQKRVEFSTISSRYRLYGTVCAMSGEGEGIIATW